MAGAVFLKLGRAVLAGALLVAALSVSACGREPKGEPVTPKDGVFAIDEHGVAPGQVRFYRYDTGGKSIVFFVARGSGGGIRTAFDACRSCYPKKLGYRAGDGSVTCVACGMVFKLDELEKGEGGCVPVSLPSNVSGGRVVIEQKDVESGAPFF